MSSPTLRELLLDSERAQRVVVACRELVEREVAGKRGFSGAAVRTGFGVVKKLRPGVIDDAVVFLLPDFADALEVHYQNAIESGRGAGDRFARALNADTEATAEILLGVTDRRISEAGAPLQKTYRSLRKTAKGHVSAAVPGLAETLAPFVDEGVAGAVDGGR